MCDFKNNKVDTEPWHWVQTRKQPAFKEQVINVAPVGGLSSPEDYRSTLIPSALGL